MLVHMYLDINDCIFNTFYYSSVCQGVLGLNFKTSSAAMRWDAEAEPPSIHVLNTVATAKPLTHHCERYLFFKVLIFFLSTYYLYRV